MKKYTLIFFAILAIAATSSWAFWGGNREPVVFYQGHTHENGETIDAPSHSGGLDRRGCHNASVPYHCH